MPNRDRPESLFSILKSVGEFILLVCGIIGIAVEIFHEEGLLKKSLGKLMDSAFSSSAMTIVGIVILLAIAKLLYDRMFTGAENARALGNFLMKGMMILGAYFLYQVITTGSFKI